MATVGWPRLIPCLLWALAVSPVARADDQRARINYMIHCQGCHLPNAEGVPGNVPRMKDFVGYFLHSEAGRSFVVRVPGVSTAALDDEQLTELVNWMLLTYSREQLPEQFTAYTISEVAALRGDPERDPEKTRSGILADLAAEKPALRDELLEP